MLIMSSAAKVLKTEILQRRRQSWLLAAVRVSVLNRVLLCVHALFSPCNMQNTGTCVSLFEQAGFFFCCAVPHYANLLRQQDQSCPGATGEGQKDLDSAESVRV